VDVGGRALSLGFLDQNEFGCRRTVHGAWVFGYRYMDTKFATKGREIDLELYGPEIAFAFVS